MSFIDIHKLVQWQTLLKTLGGNGIKNNLIKELANVDQEKIMFYIDAIYDISDDEIYKFYLELADRYIRLAIQTNTNKVYLSQSEVIFTLFKYLDQIDYDRKIQRCQEFLLGESALEIDKQEKELEFHLENEKKENKKCLILSKLYQPFIYKTPTKESSEKKTCLDKCENDSEIDQSPKLQSQSPPLKSMRKIVWNDEYYLEKQIDYSWNPIDYSQSNDTYLEIMYQGSSPYKKRKI